MADTIGNEANVISQTHAAQKQLGANYVPTPAQKQAQKMAVATGQPSFWGRIQQIGVGQVNLLNAEKLVKNTAVSTAKGAEGAATGIARMLPGGQNDLKVQAQGTTNANIAAQNIIRMQKEGKLSHQQASKLLNQQASSASQSSAAVNKTIKSEPTTKEFAGDVAQTALLGAPGAGKAVEATGADLLKTFGTQGVKDLAAKAGVDLGNKASVEGAQVVAKTKIAQQAFSKATTNIAKDTAKSSAKGAAGFGAFSAAGTAGQGGSNKQIIKAGAVAAAEGAVAGAAGSLLIKSKLNKAPNIEKGTAPKEDITPSPINDLGKAAEARNAFVGRKAVGGSQVAEAITQNKTKLLGTGEGKIEGNGFTATPSVNATKVKMLARLNTINTKLSDVAQGKIQMASEDIKALKTEKADIYKQSREATLPSSNKSPAEPTTSVAGKTTSLTTERGSGIKSEQTGAKLASTTNLKPLKTTGSVAPSQLSVKVNARAVENKLGEDLGEAKEHGIMDVKQQAQKATDLINTDEKKATDIATGKRNAPSGIHPHAVFVAVENKAIKDGNVDLLRQLSHSKRVDESTAAGQTLRILRERDQDSPVAAMQQVAKVRADIVAKKIGSVPKAISQTTKEIDSHIKPVSKDSWSVFLESVKC